MGDGKPIRDEEWIYTGVAIGLPLFFLYLLDSFAQRDELERMLAHAARHDPLTGLLNRAGFAELATDEFAANRAANKPATVAMIDIDHFKSINDGWGHAAGDAVLCAIARTLRREIRARDIIARSGGEEFILLLIDVTPLHASVLLDRLRNTLSREVPHPGAPEQQVTFSVGLALAEGEGLSAIEVATRRADKALYVAKASGRNRVVISDPERRLASLIGSS